MISVKLSQKTVEAIVNICMHAILFLPPLFLSKNECSQIVYNSYFELLSINRVILLF
jgi:hypothetical protein